MGAPAVSASPRSRPARKPQSAARRSAAAQRVTAPSQRTRTRASAPARRRATAPHRRPRHTPAGGVVMFPVHAVAGTAGAVGGLADSSLVVTLTRSRAWIAALGLLLGGIVALNVWGLSLSASTSGTSKKIDELQQANSVLGARIARRSSTDKIATIAAGAGLDTPTPKAIRYLEASPVDATRAAKRLAAGKVSVLSALPIAPEFAEVGAAVEPAAPVADTAPPADVAAAPAPTDTAAAPAPEVAPAPTATASPDVNPGTEVGGVGP
jgi:hypothetical protein